MDYEFIISTFITVGSALYAYVSQEQQKAFFLKCIKGLKHGNEEQFMAMRQELRDKNETSLANDIDVITDRWLPLSEESYIILRSYSNSLKSFQQS